jgi:hypothetical protein
MALAENNLAPGAIIGYQNEVRIPRHVMLCYIVKVLCQCQYTETWHIM